MNHYDRETTRKRLEGLAWLMDNAIPIPGLKARVGLDALIGLVPWVGDLVGGLVTSYILSEAARLGAPKPVLLKMAFNIAVDTVVGAIPFAGDLFDFRWKANIRNVRLLEHYLERPQATVRTSRLFVLGLVVLVLLFIAFIGMLAFLAARALWDAFTGL